MRTRKLLYCLREISAVFILLSASVQYVYAQPAIQAVSPASGLAHGQTLVINGGLFGIKVPATPLWWDDGEGAASNSRVPQTGEMTHVISTLTGSAKHYNDALPSSVTQGSGVANIHYRNSGFRNVASPHSHSTMFITGGHDDEGECAGGGEPGQNVGVVVGDTSRHTIWFVHYYLRLDPLWPINSPQNYKFFDVTTNDPATRPTMYSNATGATYAAGGPCGCGSDPRSRMGPNCGETWWGGMTGDFLLLNPATCPSAGSPICYGNIVTRDNNKPNPIYQWTAEEWQLNYATQKVKFSVNNALHIDTSADADCSFNLTRVPAAFSAFTIGGFWKERTCPNGQDDLNDNAWRYFDDLYVDNTYSRVVLTDNAVYEDSTIVEPQIPSAWNNGSITVRVNLGKLPQNGRAYLFVFDANNNHSQARCVPLGSGSCGDVIKPTPPSLL